MKKILLVSLLLVCIGSFGYAQYSGESVYTEKPDDKEAFYFPPSDGKTDVSEALQDAINQVHKKSNFGIVFLPQGTYKISRTIYIPRAVRVIGYGEKRPTVVLAKNSPGFQQEVPGDKGKAAYMFWFTNNRVEDESRISDAGAGTFYSALSNVNLKIEDGNPHAVALRTHFAQHSFISHVDIQIGNGKAGLFDVGNEMHNVRFFGGEYGIYTTKASPGWQMMMVDTYFEKQRRAAIFSQEGGLTIVRMQAKDVPAVVEIEENYLEKLIIEDSRFENVKQQAIVISNENNAANQISLRNVICRNVPVIASFRRSGTQTVGEGKQYRIADFRHGLHQDNLNARPEMRTVVELEAFDQLPPVQMSDIPALPPVNTWVNVKDLGAKGDGDTDDTQIFLSAIERYENIYVPQGWYIISEPLVLKANTNLIGLHPIATQLILKESTPSFSGFGSPQPLLETPAGGKNIVNGIGLNTGGYNYRAVGCKWMAGEGSYMNDVKFVGGHGTIHPPREGEPSGYRPRTQRISSPADPVAAQGKDLAWDNQYWSLWVTNGGGGVFKDIWTASTYSTSGLYVSNTSTPGRIYAMSLEHHVRNEARFKNVSNWKIYAFQLEEESREGQYCQPVELENCSHIMFANTYMFQVIRVNTPYPYSIRTWNCRDIEFLNLHNYAQTKYSTTLPLYDINRNIEVRPWEINRLYITGNEATNNPVTTKPGEVVRLATGFEFSEGTTSDSKGNIYFSEQRLRRIYKWSVADQALSLVADFPWDPMSLACDTEDNLLVVFRYSPQPGFMVDGKQETVTPLPDAGGTSFSGWGNSGFAVRVYSIDPENPEETIRELPRVKMGSVGPIHKALYPGNRWRDFHDFNTVVMYRPEYCFVAPDGKTIIPQQYDLARSSSLLEAFPGKPFYTTDEYDKRIVRLDVDARGYLSNLEYFVEMGEFGSAVDTAGNLYIADGQVYIFNPEGNPIGEIEIPERPLTLRFGGKDSNTLFINSYKSLFQVKIK